MILLRLLAFLTRRRRPDVVPLRRYRRELFRYRRIFEANRPQNRGSVGERQRLEEEVLLATEPLRRAATQAELDRAVQPWDPYARGLVEREP